jgi:hypothetical protein
MKALGLGLLVGALALGGCANNPSHRLRVFGEPTERFATNWAGEHALRADGAHSSRLLVSAPAQDDPRDAAATVSAGSKQGTPPLVSGSPQRTAYALVVGIERYRDLPPVVGARADAERYAALVGTTLGLPQQNVRVLVDDRATRADVEQGIEWLQQSVPAGGRAYLFFSGHGAPDTKSGQPFLVTYEGNPKSLTRTSLPLSEVMKSLEATKGKDALAVVDACFSGSGGRSVLPEGARPLMVVKDERPQTKLALFSASSGAQISGPTLDRKGGLFSSMFVQGLGTAAADVDGDGQITLSELDQWLKPRVEREAKSDQREQTPSLVLGRSAGQPGDFVVAYGVAR